MSEPTKTVTVQPTAGVRTCVPQILHLNEEGETLQLFLRVAAPRRKCKLVLKSGGKVVGSKFLPVAKPSEMITVTLPAAKCADLQEVLEVGLEGGL